MSLNQNDDWYLFTSTDLDLESRVEMAANSNTLKNFLPMTGFLDTEISPSTKLTLQNKGQNVDTKYWLNGRDLTYIYIYMQEG